MAENNHDEQDLLIKWKDDYSKIETITGNDIFKDNDKLLLNGNAAGTSGNSYLDPVPFVNLLTKVYTNIIAKGENKTSARTDSLKMNREYMDYTLYDPNKEAEPEDNKQGLNLLMPQYQRRVEVEDLDENFWVISLALDAVLKALWGPYGLIDIVRKLIGRFSAVEKFLGLNDITGIELLYEGNNDLYFDMYSRFNLYSLAIKLKTNSGERIIKDIISKTDNTHYREGLSFSAGTREELFRALQKQICEDENNKLYDSELISSESAAFSNGDENDFVLLSDVIKAINNNIQNENGERQLEFRYEDLNEDSTELKEFLKRIDGGEEKADNILTFEERQLITQDLLNIKDGSTITYEQYKRALNYKNAYSYIQTLTPEQKNNLATAFQMKIKDDNETNFSKLEEDLFETKEVSVNFPYNINDEDSKEVLSNFYQDELNNIRTTLDTYKNISFSENQDKEISNNLEYSENKRREYREYVYTNYGLEYFRELAQIVKAIKDKSNIENGITNYKYYIYKRKKHDNETEKAEQLCIREGVLPDNIGKDYILFEIPSKITINLDIQKTVSYKATLLYDLAISKYLLFEEVSNISDTEKTKDWFKEFYFSTKKHNNGYIYQKFFDVNKQTGLDLNDCITVSKYLLSTNQNSNSQPFMDFIETIGNIRKEFLKVDFLFEKPINNEAIPDFELKSKKGDFFENKGISFFYHFFRGIAALSGINFPENPTLEELEKEEYGLIVSIIGLIEHAVNKSLLDDETRQNIIIDKISKYFFNKFETDEKEIFLNNIKIYVPRQRLALQLGRVVFSNQSTSSTEGWYITSEDTDKVLTTIKNTQYGLFGNIVLFLYDKDYYKYVIDDDKQGLKIIGNDKEYFLERETLIEGKKEGEPPKIIPLFIGREDLINGEILQLRLTQKDSAINKFGDENVHPYQIDFNKLIKDNSDPNSYIIEDKNPEIFLSLYNSFSNKLSQYNFRTSLFFKDTTPFTKNLNEDEMPKNLDDWFRNGIVCTYFRPIENTNSNGEITLTANVINKPLKIKASMIAKNELYIDNSFVSESIAQKAEKPTILDNEYSYQANHSFKKECAYFAAMRHNLIFYSSPPQNEFDQFIHSPGKLLLSPNIKPSDDTIQTARLSTTKPSDVTQWKWVDALPEREKRCYLTDVKDMIYNNAYGNYPLQIEAIFGRRNVDEYVKPKSLQYIVIDREKGTRHKTYGPTNIELTLCSGYLHSKDGLYCGGKPLSEIQWYNEEGTVVGNDIESSPIHNSPSENGLYGVASIDKELDKMYYDTFMIRFYSSASEGKLTDFNIPTTEGGKPNRRPIFSMAYFFGVDDSRSEKEKEANK